MALKLKKKSTKEVKKVVKKATPVSAAPKKASTSRVSSTQLTYPTGTYVEGIGRRKVATSRVRLYATGGDFIVNDLHVSEYFAGLSHAARTYMKPFDLTGTNGKFGVTVKVSGSGIAAQIGAVVHGIARALVKFDPEFKALIKPSGLLTRDDRMKETRKIGMGGKARRKRQSPKR